MKIICPCCNEEIFVSVIAIPTKKKLKYDEPSFNDVSMDEIERIVCKTFHVTKEEILGESKKGLIVLARQTFMYLCAKYSENMVSLERIAGRMNRTNHSTAIHAKETISDIISIYEARKLDKYRWKYLLITEAEELVQNYFISKIDYRKVV